MVAQEHDLAAKTALLYVLSPSEMTWDAERSD